jgi:hypothetical protein
MLNAAKNGNFSNIDFKSLVNIVKVNENNNKRTNIEPNKQYIEEVDFNDSCRLNKHLCLLIQHYENVETFGNMIENNFDNIKYDFYNLLFQVYFGLGYLGKHYTHYDLHTHNVLLYKPYNGKKYITMKYYYKGKINIFKTEYIAKIIDYGRNYFDNKKTNTKTIISQLICSRANAPDCNSNGDICGSQVGYSTISGNITVDPTDDRVYEDSNYDFYWIFPNKPNLSHDLRLYNTIVKSHKVGLPKNYFYANNYGTPENMNVPFNGNFINNIRDMIDWLSSTLDTYNSQALPKKYDNTWEEAGIMEIFDDGRDYTYTPIQTMQQSMSTASSASNSANSSPIFSISI